MLSNLFTSRHNKFCIRDIFISYTSSSLLLILLILSIAVLSSCATQKKNATSANPYRSLTNFDADDYIKGHNLTKKQCEIIEEICSWEGTPYRYGGAEKGIGADCSGLILRVFLDIADVKLPRNSAEQAEFCKQIKPNNVEACDLVFFATGRDPDKVSHVGLLLDTENFIHSSSSKGVIVTRLDSPWWHDRIKKFGRVPGYHK